MKKALLLAAVAALIVGSAAVAQESAFWFDIRTNQNDIDNPNPAFPWANGQFVDGDALNGGNAGDGQILRLTPQHGDGFETVFGGGWPAFDDANNSTGDLHLYMDVLDDDDAGSVGDVIASIGIDMGLSGGGAANSVALTNYSWTLPAEANSGSTDGAESGGSWLGAKAVKVPVEDAGGPSYAIGLGMVPVNTYHVGTLSAEGGIRQCPPPAGTPGHDAASTFEVRLSVNNLLITRVYSTPGDADEQVAFGYSAGAAGYDLASISSGSGEGNPAGLGDADALIVVKMKGDNDGNGIVDVNDTGGFVAAKAASSGPPFLVSVTQDQLFLNDFVTLAPPGDTNRVDSNDTGGFVDAKLTGGVQPFPPPGNCP